MTTGSRTGVALVTVSVIAAAACGGGDDGNTVTYRAESIEVAEAEVEYTGPDGVERATVELPWSVTFDVGDEFDGEIVVTNPTDEGAVECTYEPSGFRPVVEFGDVSATCGGSFSVDGSTASGSFYSDRVNRDDVPPDDEEPVDDEDEPTEDAAVPIVSTIGVSEGAGPDGSFAPTDPVFVEMEITSLGDGVRYDIRADTTPPGSGDAASYESTNRIAIRGEQFDDDVLVLSEQVDAPAGGWEVGVHSVSVVILFSPLEDGFEPFEETFDLEFGVATFEAATVSFESSGGQIRLDHPSDWSTEESSPPASFTSYTGFGPALPFDGSGDSLLEVATTRPTGDDPGARVRVYLEQARLTAPPVDEWTEIRLAALTASGVEVTSDETADRTHGPVRRVVGTFEDESVVVDFTQSADRLYIVELVTTAAADEGVVAAGEAVFDSVVLVPDAEPPPTPVSESRSVSFTVDDPDGGVAADASFTLPASWDLADELTEPAPNRFLLRSNGPERTDGFEPIEGYLYLELLDPPPTTEDYAQFWIDRSAEEFADAGYELVEQSAFELNLEPAVRATWQAAGEVVDEAFVVSGDVGITLRFEFQEGTEDPRLLDALAPELFVLPNE